MLRITPCVSAAAAKRYFRQALSRGDYYTHPGVLLGQEIVGQWGGHAARRLGLHGDVTAEAFERLCDNLHPQTGEKLTPRTKTDRRVLYDFTFSVPKSVSAVLELLDDRRIVDAFRAAVRETLEEAERDMKTRVRRGGADTDRITGNMVYGEFVHFTSRPVDGIPDPHLHIHATVFNTTWDEVEQRWKAGEFCDLKRDAPYHQAACDARLAMKLADLGYSIERRGESAGAWEIAGVPDSIVRRFSRRTEEIERLADELGIIDPELKAGLGARSRNRKLTAFTMEELREQWFSMLSARDRQALGVVGMNASLGFSPLIDRAHAAELALDHAVGHGFERASVLPERRLLERALVWGVGSVTPDDVATRLATLATGGEILRATVEGETLVTTRAVLEEEHRMLATVRDGRGTHPPLKADHVIEDEALSAEQRRAVRHVLESTDSVVLVQGRAGVGKTRMMQEVAKAVASAGLRLQAAAPTAMATHEVLRKDGFRDPQTVAAILGNPAFRSKLQNQVLWVDEAGLVSVSDMARLVRLADETGARLILSGDTRQHRAVVRGDALRLMESESGLTPVLLKEVRRQRRTDYREAAETLSKGNLIGGFTKLENMGAIREAGEEERSRLVADLYQESIARGRSVLVVAPTHLEGRLVTQAIREQLKESKIIAGKDAPYTRLHNRQLTEAQRRDAASYRENDVVHFHQNCPGGFRPGDRAEVVTTSSAWVKVERARDQAVVDLPLDAAKRFQVFEPQAIALATGDRVRISYNGRDASGRHRLSNGAIYTITRLHRDGRITLDNGWQLAKNFGHIAHGYAVTSDASQGRTVDHVIVAQSTLSSAASNVQQWYTSVTRGRHEITVVTDDKDRLLKALARDNARMSATELAKLAVTPPGRDGMEHGSEHRKHAGLWMARENTRRMKQEVNRHLQRQERQRARERQTQERRRRQPSREGGVSRER